MQGFNMGRYRPPASLDASLGRYEQSKAGAEKHHLGARARKLPQGVLTVRFEMPFAIWCQTCPSTSSNALIGEGVRFNAEKKKVGNYFTTPVWSFRMKHAACGGWIEIRTDPKNTEFIVTEGARRRDTGDDASVAAREGGMVIGGTEEEIEREKRRQDAFATLEGKKKDEKQVKEHTVRIEELRSLRERDWRDTDAKNRQLRSAFRVDRKAREKSASQTEALRERMGLDIDIVAETAEDVRRAGLVVFGEQDVEELDGDAATFKATAKPLFSTGSRNTSAESSHSRAKTKTSAADAKRQALQQHLTGNSRAANNPFALAEGGRDDGSPLSLSRAASSTTRLGLRKRQRDDDAGPIEPEKSRIRMRIVPTDMDSEKKSGLAEAVTSGPGSSLVAYDSDD